ARAQGDLPPLRPRRPRAEDARGDRPNSRPDARTSPPDRSARPAPSLEAPRDGKHRRLAGFGLALQHALGPPEGEPEEKRDDEDADPEPDVPRRKHQDRDDGGKDERAVPEDPELPDIPRLHGLPRLPWSAGHGGTVRARADALVTDCYLGG